MAASVGVDTASVGRGVEKATGGRGVEKATGGAGVVSGASVGLGPSGKYAA